MNYKIRSRPERRTGGGGFGHYKTMNKEKEKMSYRPATNRDRKQQYATRF